MTLTRDQHMMETMSNCTRTTLGYGKLPRTHLLPDPHSAATKYVANMTSRVGGIIRTSERILESDSHRRLAADDKQMNVPMEMRRVTNQSNRKNISRVTCQRSERRTRRRKECEEKKDADSLR
jgi:hypothetical protein